MRTMPGKVTVLPYPPGCCPSKSQPPRRINWRGWYQGLRILWWGLFHRQYLLVNLLAFLFGRVILLGELSPFGLALCAAVAGIAAERFLAAGFWAVLGAVTAGGNTVWVYLMAMGVFYRLIRGQQIKTHKKLLAFPVLIAFSVLVARTLVTTVTHPVVYNYLLALFEAGLTFVLTVVFLYGLPLVMEDRSGRAATREELIAGVVLIGIVVAGISGYRIWGYSLQHILGRFCIMLLALVGGGGTGAAIGVTIGMIVGLTSAEGVAGMGLYGFSGLLGGMFNNLGKLGVSTGFMVGNTIFTLYINQPEEIVASLTESIAALLALLLIPGRQISWLQRLLSTDTAGEIPTEHRLKELTYHKILRFAQVFYELAAAFGPVAAVRERMTSESSNQLLEAVIAKVCEQCGQKTQCWEREFYRTYRNFSEMLAQAEVGGQVVPRRVPEPLRRNCGKVAELINTMNVMMERHQVQTYWRQKVQDHRLMLAEQLRGLAGIMENFAREFQRDPDVNKELAGRIMSAAEQAGYQLDGVKVQGGAGADLEIEIGKPPCPGTRECAYTIAPLVDNLVKGKLLCRAECARETRRPSCRLSFVSTEKYRITTGIATAAKHTSGVSGDTYSILPLSRGRIAVLLSDGMGIGSVAAQESMTTINLLEQLLAAGFELDVAVRTANAMLLLRGPDETFATVDLVVIDLCSAEAEFLKIGCSPSFIKRVREVIPVRSTSLPIGILTQIDIDTTKASLSAGDCIVMMTDGVLDTGRLPGDKEEWVARALRRMATDHPQEIADLLLEQAKANSGGQVRDDMTVLAVKIEYKPTLQ